jgi:hypothetical protein
MAIDVFGIVDDSLEKLGILYKQIPIKRHILGNSILMRCLILGGLPVSDEEDVVLLILVVHHQ